MTKFQYDEEPIIVSRDAGYSIAKTLDPENRKKARELVENRDYVNSKCKLKEIFAEFGVIVNPNAMTYLFNY